MLPGFSTSPPSLVESLQQLEQNKSFTNSPPQQQNRSAMLRTLMATATTARPPLPQLPEAPIFDPPYNTKLAAVLNGSAFPATMSPEQVYRAQYAALQSVLDDLSNSSWHLSIALLFAWLLMIVMGGYLLFRLRRYREQSLAGDAKVARKIVLPAFEPLLWLLVVINLVFIVIYSALLTWTDYLAHKNKITIEIIVALKQFNPLLVPVYMLQPSLSRRALIRATLQTVLLAGYTVPLVMVLRALETPANTRMCFWILTVARCLLTAFILFYMVYPPARASTRVFRLNCGYNLAMTAMIMAMALSFHNGDLDWSKAIGWVIAVYALVLPACDWQLLRADTEHWRGIGKRAVELQDVFRRKIGKVDERVSSQGLHVLIEMHRKYIIDFAHLQLREPIRQNVRSTNQHTDGTTAATVFRGFLQTKKIPVAVKIYMPTQFTEETVAEFSHEAALCGSLVHPNIIKFHGLCVCPPNICLVTELCAASLQEVIDAHGVARRRGRRISPRRQQFLVDLGYMIDAARAVAYLHSFSPAFVHCDIKPSNFLIDDQGTVKLTDFGASRTLAAQSLSNRKQVHSHTGGHHPRDLQSTTGRRVLEMPTVPTGTSSSAKYTAPEVLDAQQEGTSRYGEYADVYSLGVTMLEITRQGLDTNIVLGSAADQPAALGLHPGLEALIDAACHSDPRHRPTAQALVATLEIIQEEVAAIFALAFLDTLHERRHRQVDITRAPQTWSRFAGAQAVEKLRVCEFVRTQGEAIRLGSMLMDSGFLHHTKHARSFGDCKAQFFFDEEQISLCQPFVMLDLEDDRECDNGHSTLHPGSTTDTVAPGRRPLEPIRIPARGAAESPGSSSFQGRQARANSRSSHALMEQRCACRKLGQRLTSELTTRRRFRDKFKVFSDENLLTANLLADDTNGGDFAAFREPSARRGGGFGANATASEAA